MDQHETFLKLLLTHQSDVRAFLSSMVRDRSQAEDLFQEVCLVLWKSFASYDPERSFGAWARGIAAKKVLQTWEKSKRLPLAFSPRALQAVLEAYTRTERDPAHAEGLRDCIQKLPDRSRRLLALRYEKSFTLARIAQEVDSTLDAVHKLLSRIRGALQECIERRVQAGDRG
jgi:RNA polymerase sigma-70 factor (ECF subfamily)